MICVNCGHEGGDVKLMSPDMDIKPVALCEVCTLLLTYGMIGEFDEMADKRKKT